VTIIDPRLSKAQITSGERRDRELHYFRLLTFDEQVAAIQRLAASGMTPRGIGAATGVSAEQIATIIGAARARCEGCE
jgi:hypothetical protein